MTWSAVLPVAGTPTWLHYEAVETEEGIYNITPIALAWGGEFSEGWYLFAMDHADGELMHLRLSCCVPQDPWPTENAP